MARHYDNIIVMGKSGAGKQPRIEVLTEAFGLKQLSTGDIFRTYLGRFNDLNYEGSLEPFYDSNTGSFIDDAEIKKTLGISDRSDADDIVLGLKAKYYVDQGLFVPDETTDALFESAFKALGYRGAVLDGFPRTMEQARFLRHLCEKHGVRLDAVLLVDNDDDAIIERTTGRRICKTCGEVFHVDFKPPPKNEDECDARPPDCNIVQRSDDTTESLKARLNEFQTKTRPAIDYLTELGIPLYTVPGNLPEFSPETVKASVFNAMQIG